MRKEDCKPGIKVKVIRNGTFARSLDSEVELLNPGTIVELQANIYKSNCCIFFSYRSKEDSVYYIRPKKFSNFILIADIEPYQEQPEIKECKCDIWKGCTCGVFEYEMKNKKSS